MGRYYLVFVCVFVSIFFTGIQASSPYIQSIGVREGLSEPSAISIWQDHIGRMWFGNNAVNCYNGKFTNVIRPSEYFPEIEDVNIHHLCGNDSLLFFIAERTVLALNIYTGNIEKKQLKAASMFLAGENLFTGYKHTVEQYHYPTHTSRTLFTVQNTTIRMIIPDSQTHIWVGTNNGVYLINIQNGKKEAVYCEDSSIRSLYKDKSNNLWFGCEDGTIQVLTNKGELLTFGEIHALTYCFTQDSEGKIWIGTQKGLFTVKINPETGKPGLYGKNPIIKDSQINALYIDRQNTLWVGPYYGDIRYLNSGEPNFNIYISNNRIDDQLRGTLLCTIAEDNEKNLYIGTRGSGFNIFDKDMVNLRYLNVQSGGLPNNHIYTTYFDKEHNRLYVGSNYQNLYYIDTKTKQTVRLTPLAYSPPTYSTIKKILPYKDQLILITQNDGFYLFDRHKQTTVPLFTDSTLRAKCTTNIRTAFIDDQDCLWVSSLEEGLFTADLNSGKLLDQYGSAKNGFPYIINGICGNSINGIYLSTLNHGILAFDAEKKLFNQYGPPILLSNHCFNIGMSAYGRLIVTSNKGFSVIDISVKKKPGNAFHIHLNDLHPLNGFNSDCEIYSSPFNKKNYLGTLNGMVVFDEYLIGRTNNNYQLFFSELKVNSSKISPTNSDLLKQDIAFTNKLSLSSDQNTFSLYFSSTNFSSIKHTQYEYNLKGLDTHWLKTENSSITYSSLRPGKYTLTVRESDDHEKMISIDIEILPPLWLSWPALLLYYGLSAGIILWIIRFNRSKRLLRESLESEKRKQAFLTQISDEFRAPLTIIITLLNSIAADEASTGKRRIYKVIKQALYLQNLITRMLDFSIEEKGEINLHKTQEEEIEEPVDEETEEANRDTHFTMLLIEQDKDIRSLIREQFSFAYTVIECDNGDEGYSIATQQKPDIIICEEIIQGLSGIEVCKMLKSNIETLHIPFVILSHQPSSSLRMQIIRSGADDYFVKPFEMNMLLQRCNNLISNRRNMLKYLAWKQDHTTHPIVIADTLQNQQFIERSNQIIEENLSNIKFDTQLWCKELGIGRTSLFAQFKEITGMTPNDYLLQYKIKKAERSLCQKDLSISEIGYSLGYSDPGYFSRSFKKITGQSPLQFRKKYMLKNEDETYIREIT